MGFLFAISKKTTKRFPAHLNPETCVSYQIKDGGNPNRDNKKQQYIMKQKKHKRHRKGERF